MNRLSHEPVPGTIVITQEYLERSRQCTRFLISAFEAAREIGWDLDERLVETVAEARLAESFTPSTATLATSKGVVEAGLTVHKIFAGLTEISD